MHSDGGVNIQELDSARSLTKQLVRGTGMGGGIGSVLYTEDASAANREFFCYNAIGSVVAMTDSTGTVTSTTSYEAFGKEVASTGSTSENRKFCTKERDASIGLDNFGFRMYDPELGRFTTRDPAGMVDGPNVYLYCGNNPINRIDPLGLWSWYEGWGATAKELGKMAWSSVKETASVVGEGTAALATGDASTVDFAKNVGNTAKGAYDSSVEKAADRMSTQMQGGASEGQALLNTLALTVHDATGATDIGEAIAGVDTRDAHELSDVETAQRYIGGTSKLILTGVAITSAAGKVDSTATFKGSVKETVTKVKKVVDKVKQTVKKIHQDERGSLFPRKQVFKGKNLTRKQAKNLRDSQGKRTIKRKSKRKGKQKKVWTRQQRNKAGVGNKPDGPHQKGGKHYHDDNHLDPDAPNLHTGDFK